MPRTSTDYYAILEVTRSATQEEIKRAYRRLAILHHPDRNPEDSHAEERFKACVEAYSVLGDVERRRHYDLTGTASLDGVSGIGIDLSEILDAMRDMFSANRRGRHYPTDIEHHLDITLEQAASGAELTIYVDRLVPCTTCDGSGAAFGTTPRMCIHCKGRGEVRKSPGIFASKTDCEHCHGRGRIIDTPCRPCDGQGRLQRTEALTVQVPPGIEDGKTRTIRGAGNCGREGVGDLHVYLHIQPHPVFRREGADIYCDHWISYSQAVLGGELDVPTLAGTATMKLPAGTLSGKTFRLRGKGMPVLGGYGKGDQYVSVLIDVPKKLTKEQRRLIKQLARELPQPTLSSSSGPAAKK